MQNLLQDVDIAAGALKGRYIATDTTVKASISDSEKRYYAVARGAITGIFLDVEIYDKAVKGVPFAMGRVFKNIDAAKAWMNSVRGKNPVQSRKRKKSRRERWAEENAAILAANREVTPVVMPVKEIKHTSDPNLLLAERLESFWYISFMKDAIRNDGDCTDADFTPETLAFIAFGHSRGYDYVTACEAYITERWDEYSSQQPKQIAAIWMKKAAIPSGYKLLMKNLLSVCHHRVMKQMTAECAPDAPEEIKVDFDEVLKAELAWVESDREASECMKDNFRKKVSSPGAYKSAKLKTNLGDVLAEVLHLDLPQQEPSEVDEPENDKHVADGIHTNCKKTKKPKNKAERKKAKIAAAPAVPADEAEKIQEIVSELSIEPMDVPTHKEGLFRGVQFDKHVFRGMSPEAQKRFCKTFLGRLAKLEQIFHGNSRAAGNDFRLVSPLGRRVFKRRIGKNRLSMVFRDGILTLLKFSNHDRQMADIRNIQGKTIGYVYYDMDDFLRQMETWPKADKHMSFGDYMGAPQHFVFDNDQKAIIESGGKAENLSVIGNAGAGKSVVGLKWLHDQLQKPKHNCLYLTMSENLVYTLEFEFNKGCLSKKDSSRADIRTTFDFLRSSFKKEYPKIAENRLLNAAQSFALFRRFWAEEVDWAQFWNCKEKRSALQSEEATLLSAWREIHGILKGAVPIGLDYTELKNLPEVLPEQAYRESLRREKKDSVRGVRWIDALYRTYEKYQEYLHRRQLFDDNDIARMLLQTPSNKSKTYAAAFVDECQDLTQMELLAIFHLLGGVKVKRMSSDRCQMVQPTYFDEGWMRTTANEYDLHLGKKMEEAKLKPSYLHYNYRSSRSIIDFQNYAVQYLRYNDILTLKQMETEKIIAPPLTTKGARPIWITPGVDNQQTLIEDLWKKLDASELQTIFAFPASPSKQDFTLSAADAVTDVVSCKGMEYPSVLLYNILSETRFDPVMAWKYFYVGATRGNRCLLIYEEDAVPGTRAYDFLSAAADAGLIDRCDNLLAQAKEDGLTWLGYIYQCVSENADENRLETAENALNFGQYELALNIFTQEGKDKNMIAYCRGKVMEKRGDFHQAVESYANLEADWNDRGRTRENSVDSMLGHPDIGGAEFLGAYFLSRRGEKDLLTMAKNEWTFKYGNETGFYEAFFDALEFYPFTAEHFHKWTESIIEYTGKETEKIRQTAAGWEE